MSERERIELIRDMADWRFRETNDHWWLKVAVVMARKLNEGNYYDKKSRQGMALIKELEWLKQKS